jgi:hypothetical protein
MVDTRDLKSLDRKVVRVRVPPRAPVLSGESLAFAAASPVFTLDVPLTALGAKGRGWKLREFADGADPAAPETVVETTRDLGDTRTLTLAPGGGYAAALAK